MQNVSSAGLYTLGLSHHLPSCKFTEARKAHPPAPNIFTEILGISEPTVEQIACAKAGGGREMETGVFNDLREGRWPDCHWG